MDISSSMVALTLLQLLRLSHQSNNDKNLKMFCQYDNRDGYRSIDRDNTSYALALGYCTDILLGFSTIHMSTLEIEEESDEPVIALFDVKKKLGLSRRIHLTVGDPDSHNRIFEPVFKNNKNFKLFVDRAERKLRKNGYDGLNILWEATHDKDSRKYLLALCKALSKKLKSSETRQLQLSLTVSPFPGNNHFAYDVTLLNRSVDYFIVKAFDYFGNEDVDTHYSPLDISPSVIEKGETPPFSASASIRWWKQRVESPRKLIFGIPTYSRSIDAQMNQSGIPGRFSEQSGVLSYYEICEIAKTENLTEKTDEYWKAPLLYHQLISSYYISFMNPIAMESRCWFIKEQKYGGAMIWTVDHDDFRFGLCGKGRYPLLKKISQCLLSPSRRRSASFSGEPDGQVFDWLIMIVLLCFIGFASTFIAVRLHSRIIDIIDDGDADSRKSL